MMQMNLHIKDMAVIFCNSPEMERINNWFQFANELCETGRNKKPKGYTDEQRTRKEVDKTDQDGTNQSEK